MKLHILRPIGEVIDGPCSQGRVHARTNEDLLEVSPLIGLTGYPARIAKKTSGSVTNRSKMSQCKAKGQFPMVVTGGGVPIYQPSPLKDAAVLSARLPRMTQCSYVWINCFFSLFKGTIPCMGDLRQAMANFATPTEARAVEEMAGTDLVADAVLIQNHMPQIFDAIRDIFPDPITAAPTCFPCDDSDPLGFYSSYVQAWTDAMGRDPGQTRCENVMFRTAIVTRLQKEVKTVQMANPDLMVTEEPRF